MSDTLTKRALFDLLRTRPLTAAEASLYPRVLPAMAADGIARRLPDGGYALAINGAEPPATASTPPPAGEPMPTISARVTMGDIAFLEHVERSQGLTRADAIRLILERARAMGDRFFGSSARRRAVT